MREKSSEISEQLATRCEQAEPISVEEFRRLFLKGLAALLRETDSIAYRIKRATENRY